MKRPILTVIIFAFILISCEDKEKPDTTPPELTIISPITGETYRDTVFIQVNTKDDKGIAFVDFFINDSLHFRDSTLSYAYDWDTKKDPNGDYTLKVISVDEAMNKIEKSVTISVLNLPGDYYPEKIVNFNLWGMEIEKPFIYAALGTDGLWRKNYIVENGHWEYMGFTDTTRNTGVTDVSVNGKEIIIVAQKEHFWQSQDSGKTWVNTYLYDSQEESNNLSVRNIQRSNENLNILIAIEDWTSFYKSIDGGETWEFFYDASKNMSAGFYHIKWHPIKSGELWTFGNGPMSWGELISWKDNGASLKTYIYFDEIQERVFDLTFDSFDENKMYFLGDSYIYKSNDSGLNWQKTFNHSILSDKVWYIISDPRLTNAFFIVTLLDGIYYTRDGFENYEQLSKVSGRVQNALIKYNLFFYNNGKDIIHISLEELKPF